jgi:hypothetical protein
MRLSNPSLMLLVAALAGTSLVTSACSKKTDSSADDKEGADKKKKSDDDDDKADKKKKKSDDDDSDKKKKGDDDDKADKKKKSDDDDDKADKKKKAADTAPKKLDKVGATITIPSDASVDEKKMDAGGFQATIAWTDMPNWFVENVGTGSDKLADVMKHADKTTMGDKRKAWVTQESDEKAGTWKLVWTYEDSGDDKKEKTSISERRLVGTKKFDCTANGVTSKQADAIVTACESITVDDDGKTAAAPAGSAPAAAAASATTATAPGKATAPSKPGFVPGKATPPTTKILKK